MNDLKIKNLYVYPIKSCRGIKVSSSNILNTGLQYDRFFAVINAENRVLTARENPRLLYISSSIIDNELNLSSNGMPSVSVDLNNELTETIDIQIFSDVANAKIVGSETDDWLSNVLQEKCRLVTIDSEQLRIMKLKYNGKENDFISFSDISPIHLVSLASLNDLNAKLDVPVSIDNFRPNIVVTGCEAYEEDTWKTITIGACEFEVTFKTPRCKFTTIDPVTAIVDPKQEPLRTLSTFRKEGNYINFGIYLMPKNMGRLNLSDTIKVTDARL